MEVKIKPIPGCMNIVLAILTLGIYPLAGWITTRSWPKSVDEQGLVTRGGARIAWNEFTKVTKVITKVGGSGPGVVHYELSHAKGKVVVADYRLENGEQVFNYVWNHLPEQAKKAQ